ncbi:MAG TPA: hypothetical protein PKJ10_00780 [Smithella sp.]|nr:hypothetical protein [Smithella sp.]
MDDVITRIVDIEKQCAADVEATQLEYGKNIEAHKRFLEARKTGERAEILSAENTRQSQAVEDAKRNIEALSADFITDIENHFRDQDLNEAIKKEIVSILLGG